MKRKLLLSACLFAVLSLTIPASAALSGYWKLEPTTGTSVPDSVGTHHGTLHKISYDYYWDFGQYSKALRTYGMYGNGYITLPPLSFSSNNVTLSAWVKRHRNQNPGAGIISSASATPSFGIILGENNELRYKWNSMYSDWSSGLIDPNDTWAFVTLVVAPTQATMYLGVDGVLSSSTNVASHSAESFNQSLTVACSGNVADANFIGTIDDVRVYNHALSASEIGNLYGAYRSRWTLDSAAGTTVPDSVNLFDGTLDNGLLAWGPARFHAGSQT